MRYWKRNSINNNPKIGMVVVTYEQTSYLQSLLASLKGQTWENFKIIVSHDGPASHDVKAAFNSVVGKDNRFVFQETEERKNQFGHERRYPGFVELIADGANFLCTTNGDCWYTPNYFESMLYQLQKDNSEFVYCNMVHSHKLWQPLVTGIKRGKIDVGCWMASKNLIEQVDWTDFGFTGDWSFIHKLHKISENKQSKVEGFLYVHN